MKKKSIIAIGAVVVLAAAFAGYKLIGSSKNSDIKYRKETLSRGDIESTVTTSGTLNPVTIVDVGSQVSGKIFKLYADFNTLVKKGDIVAELDQEQFNSKVDQAKANYQISQASLDQSKLSLEITKNKFDRSKQLFDNKQISYEEMETAQTNYFNAKSSLQSAEARLQQAKFQLDSANVDLSYTVIRSPVDGIVILRNVNVGQTVVASMQAAVLFKIANDLTKMQVECSIDEADIGKIKEGQKVRFTVDAFPQDQFSGVVRQVRYSPEVVSNVVTYTTVADVENPEMKLRPGMTATVSIITGEAKGALRVTNAALRFTPPIDQKELEAIMKDVRDKMAAKRGGDQSGNNANQGQPRNGEAQGRQTQGGQSQSGPTGATAQTFTGGQVPTAVGPQGQRPRGFRRQSAQVWTLDENGKVKPIFLRTGITDNTYTEILSGDLKEGQSVLIGVESDVKTSSTSQSQSGPPRGMMFMGR